MMQNKMLTSDSVTSRPLPKWLKEQKAGLHTTQGVTKQIKEDHSLSVSLAFTSIFVLLVVTMLTLYIFRKQKNPK